MTPGDDSAPLGIDSDQSRLAPHDYVVRERDAKGGTVPRSSAYHDGIPRAVPFAQTWLFAAFEAMQARDPFLAAAFARFHDDVLNPAIETTAATAAEEWETFRAQNASAREKAAAIDAELTEERKALAALVAVEADALLPLDAAVAEAAMATADAVGAAGGDFYPDQLDKDPFWRRPARGAAAVAADLGLPWPPVPKNALMSPWLYWPLSVVIGIGMGLSFGAMAGAVHFDAPENDSPWAQGFAACLGISLSAISGGAIYLASRWASSGCFAGWKRASWVPAAAVAVLSLAAIATIFAVVDQQGLLKLAALDDAASALGGGAGPSTGPNPLALLIGSLALAVPTLYMQASVGAWKGRYEIENRVAAEMEREKADAEADLRSRPETQAALAALARLRVRHWERNRAAESFAKRRQAIEARISELEKSRPAERHRLEGEGAKRVQDALDQALGLHQKQEAMIAALVEGSARARKKGAAKARGKDLRERLRALIGKPRKGGG